jgi:CheY-like chemotaxis protein
VIDDKPSIVRGLTRLLHHDGYRVATASHGRDALARLQGQGYDVILSDLRMPDLDGRAFYTLLLRRYPVAYLRAADKYFRLLLIHLDSGTQPVSLTQHGLSKPRPYLLACL